MQPDMGTAQEWLRYALSDFALASAEQPDEVLVETLCYHIHQAVEKSFKAVLVHSHVHFPYTHDLTKLIKIVKKEKIDFPTHLDEAAGLTVYATITRYPGMFHHISKEDYSKAIEIAEQVLLWAENLIK